MPTAKSGMSSTASFTSDKQTEKDTKTHEEQTTGRVLMVRPAAFGFNVETSRSNQFQRERGVNQDAQTAALREFDLVVRKLAEAGLSVDVWEDTPEPPKPDALFPNNWFTTHADGTCVLYPMEAENRRRERDPALIKWLCDTLKPKRILDLTSYEREGAYLEGTGSLVLDRVNHTAYCGLSSRSHARVIDRWLKELNYTGVLFHTDDGRGTPIYHTNVMMTIGTTLAWIVEEAIPEFSERARVRRSLEKTGRDILSLTLWEMQCFCANGLELKSKQGPLWVVSARAWAALTTVHRRRLEQDSAVLVVDIPTIENVGGGGIRCMLAEIFERHAPERVEDLPNASR